MGRTEMYNDCKQNRLRAVLPCRGALSMLGFGPSAV